MNAAADILRHIALLVRGLQLQLQAGYAAHVSPQA